MHVKFICINMEENMEPFYITAGFSGAIDVRKLEQESRRLISAGYLLAVLCFLLGVFVKGGPGMMGLPLAAKPERHIIADIITLPPKPEEVNAVTDEAPGPPSATGVPSIPEGRIPHFKAPVNDLVARLSSRPDMTGREYRNYVDRQVQILSEQFAASLPREFILPRNPDMRIPMPRYLVRDTGKYRAEVVIPPDDKRGVQGYIRIPYAWGGQLNPPDSLCLNNTRNLARALNRYTNIEAAPAPNQIRLDKTGGLTTYPVIYMTATAPFALTEDELTTLALQVGKGGLLIIDNGAPGSDPDFIARSFHEMVRKFIGWNWTSRPLPHDHILYHCFFDFSDGPPPGEAGVSGDPSKRELIGYFDRDDLVAVYCPQNYGSAWADTRNTGALRMGVNMVVYALTRYKEWFLPETGETKLVSEVPARVW